MPDDSNRDGLEALWSKLLSRDPHMVQSAFDSLSEIEQKAVLIHLERMSKEPGYHPDQRSSAEAALKFLNLSASAWDSTNH